MLGERWRESFASAIGIVAVVAIASLLMGAAPARAAGGCAESQLVGLTNAARLTAGRPPLACAADLATVAQHQAQRMAASRQIFHNPNLATEVTGWSTAGENVGVGHDANQIHEAFMASPRHRDNILSTVYTEVGMGSAVGIDGRLYVAEVFRLPESEIQVPVDEPLPSEPASDVAPPDSPAPVAQPSTVAVAPVVATSIRTEQAIAPAVVVQERDLHPRLISVKSPFRTASHRSAPLAGWLAAALAQSVLVAHMFAIWRRYKMGSGW